MSTQITLPRDAAGREIPLDTRVLYDGDGNAKEVQAFDYSPVESMWIVLLTGDFILFFTSDMHLTTPDSLEKLLDDLKNAADAANRSLSASCCTWFNGDKGCADYPADEVNDATCWSQFINDISARIRSLRGEGK